MNYRDFPRLGEAVYEERLPNGLRVRVIPKRGFARKLAFLAVDFGSIDTSFTKNGTKYRVPDGIAHYLEHKMFDLPDVNATELFASRGASPNAFTSYTMTAYYFSCTDWFEENLELLLKMVMTPYFTEESVEKERGIIAQEIRMYEDSAESRVYEDLFGAMFQTHPVRVPIAGTVESIGEITAQMLYDCHAAFYQPSNMILCVAGDVNADEVLNIALRCSPEGLAELPERDYGKADFLTESVRFTRQMPISMPTFCIGFPCTPPERGLGIMQREITGDLAAEILVGESSALYTRLYESGLIDADFSAGYESVKDACLFSMSGDSEDPEAVFAAVVEEAERIRKEGFDLALFERLKRSALGRRTRDLDSFESVCFRVCAYEFDGMDYFRFPEVYASVRPEDVQAFLTETVCAERAAVCTVYPKEES